MKYKRRVLNCIIIVISAVLFAITLRYGGYTREQIPVINEICARNFSAAADPDGNYYDYVELYNAANEDYAMDGLYLSDDRDEPRRFDMTGITVPAHGYTILWMVDAAELDGTSPVTAQMTEDEAELNDEVPLLTCLQYYCPFTISGKGAYLYISNSDSKILASVSVPALEYNVAYGCTEDGSRSYSGMEPTPGATNNGAAAVSLRKAEAPALSAESGFYEEAFSLRILHSPGTTVYYTLDGSVPTTESIRYDGPITIDDPSANPNVYSARTDIYRDNYVPQTPVDKAVVVRAIAVESITGNASDVVSGTYFVGYDKKSDYDNIAVISLITDPDNLYDYDTGIYVMGKTYDEYLQKGGFEELAMSLVPSNFVDSKGSVQILYTYTNSEHHGRLWERPVMVEYYDTNHTLQLVQNAGVRIAGESTRHQVHKSMNLRARQIYGDASWQYAFWGYAGMDKVRLRASGGEEINWKETFAQSLAEGRAVGIQRSIPCAVFMDGEYWGLYQLTEQYGTSYFENYYGASGDALMVYKNHSIIEGDKEQGMSDYDDLEEIITTYDMSQEHLYALAQERVNMDSLIDFFATNIYLGNYDISAHHNQEMWRDMAEGADNRWQYLLYDMDQTCGDPSYNMIEEYKEREGLYWPGYLCANASFRQQYVTTMMDLANVEYSYQRVHARLASKASALAAQQVASKHRYVDGTYDTEDYETAVAQIDDFFRLRRGYIEQQLQEDLGLSDVATVSVTNSDPNTGAIGVNSSVLTAEDYAWSDTGAGTWSGDYFTDYDVTLTAAAVDGYVFAGWSGDVTSEEATITIPLGADGVSVQANFVPAE